MFTGSLSWNEHSELLRCSCGLAENVGRMEEENSSKFDIEQKLVNTFNCAHVYVGLCRA
jgi:hypothetical protein